MKQQTSVEWLEMLHKQGILINKSFEIAKEMHKEETMDLCLYLEKIKTMLNDK